MMSHGSDFLHMSDESAIAGERVGTEKITKDGRPFFLTLHCCNWGMKGEIIQSHRDATHNDLDYSAVHISNQ